MDIKNKVNNVKPNTAPDVSRVTKNAVSVRNKNAGESLFEVLFGASPKEVGQNMLTKTIIPGMKDLANKTFQSLLYNGAPPSAVNTIQSTARQTIASWTPASIINNGVNPVRSYEYQTIMFDNRDDAETVLYEMTKYLDAYHFVTVMNYYDLAGIKGYDYTANSWGWDSLTSAKVLNAHGKYTITLPRAIPLR